MKRTQMSCAAVVVALVVAVGVDVAGGATASVLSAHTVKKIATKVVKKKAKHLTVRSADLLAGQPASAYADNATVYNTTITSATAFAAITLPLAPGTYVVSYSAFLSGASGATGCRLRQVSGGSTFFTADDQGDSTGSPAHSGTGVVNVTSGDLVRLDCFSASTSFITTAQEPIQIVVTPLDTVSTGTLPAG